ncbi:Protein CBFA2T3 [Anabarilius grahami]|uniref:Protein CBFA2T3 n=1 Tax=Anabarilius grahami TaxID=495550 RepID=A0A3N0YK81_ANAGA|nr:Protein CBFA2T3 [Anabarilius grahami]
MTNTGQAGKSEEDLPCLVPQQSRDEGRCERSLVEVFSTVMDSSRSSCTCHWLSSSTGQKAGTMPDSPADVKTQPRSTPPTMPPPPPAVSQAVNRNASFTPTTRLQAQVIQNRSPTLREKALNYQKEEERVEG